MYVERTTGRNKNLGHYLTAKIPKSQNPLTISDNYYLDRPLRPVPQNLENLTPAAKEALIAISKLILNNRLIG